MRRTSKVAALEHWWRSLLALHSSSLFAQSHSITVPTAVHLARSGVLAAFRSTLLCVIACAQCARVDRDSNRCQRLRQRSNCIRKLQASCAWAYVLPGLRCTLVCRR